MVLAVGKIPVLHGYAEHGGKGGSQVTLGKQRIRHLRTDRSLPVSEERDPRPSVELAVFSASQGSCRTVGAVFLHRLVRIAVVQHGAVVAGEEDQRILQNSFFLQMGNQLAHAPVQLRDHIASRSESGRASKPFVRHSGHMRLMYGIKQEEGRILTAVDETQALLQEVLRQILIPP